MKHLSPVRLGYEHPFEHRLGFDTGLEELENLLDLVTDDGVEDHATRIRRQSGRVFGLLGGSPPLVCGCKCDAPWSNNPVESRAWTTCLRGGSPPPPFRGARGKPGLSRFDASYFATLELGARHRPRFRPSSRATAAALLRSALIRRLAVVCPGAQTLSGTVGGLGLLPHVLLRDRTQEEDQHSESRKARRKWSTGCISPQPCAFLGTLSEDQGVYQDFLPSSRATTERRSCLGERPLSSAIGIGLVLPIVQDRCHQARM